MQHRGLRALLAVAFLCVAAPAVAQSGEPPARKHALAFEVPPGSIRVDGRLNEEVWDRATPVVDFVQAEPEEGARPTDPIEVRFAYDDDALYVGARMYSRNGAEIQAPMSRRDENIAQTEHMFVSLDTYLDRRTAYTFGVTAAGVRFDHYHSTDNRSRRDRGFDPVWEARVSIDSDGWVTELRIPFNQLRFTAAADTQVWGLNIYRAVPSRNEEVYWSPIRRTERVWASQFGELRGIQGVQPTRRIEILPYVAGSSLVSGVRETGNPFDNGRNLEGRTGLDLKMGLGPNVTLDATINPDFGQVEADPAEVNLTAFETFFNERRLFFLEGSQLLGAARAQSAWENDGAAYFYSRRIGARPAGSASGDFVDYPATSTILGAAKLTGRLATGTSLGLLGAVTAAESARTFTVDTASFARQRVEPRTTYAVGRVQQEFGRAGSTTGLMFTMTHRDFVTSDPLAALLTRNAFTASGDSVLRFKDGEYEIGMNLGLSHVAGETAALARLQRSSARYFQRPDADHLRYDPSRTSMTGVKGGLSAERTGGRHWLWQASAEFVTPEFEVNDLGRLTTADNVAVSAELQYRETQPGRLLRNYSIALEHEREWNFGGILQAASIGAEGEVTWRNFWTTQLQVDLDLPGQDQRLTRGGPTMGTPRRWWTMVRISNGSASQTRGNGRVRYESNEDGGFGLDLNAGITVRPTTRWQLSLGPRFRRQLVDQQYLTTLTGGRTETYGNRYVFAFVDRTTISSEIRLNYAIAPDVSLEFYGEPFTASGRYYNFGELAAPASRARQIYSVEPVQSSTGRIAVSDGSSQFTLPNRDFNVVSFRSNLVLRWEWRPGSTFYFVWQQDRHDSELRGDRVGVRDLFDTFGATGSNIFAVKATLWLGLR